MGNSISIITPSKSVDGFKNQFNEGLKILVSAGLKIAFNQTEKPNYSDLKNRVGIINRVLKSNSSIIWCAVGGDSCIDILDFINYDEIASDKLLIGSSDNTHLLLAIYLKTGVKTVFAPNVVNLPSLEKKSIDRCIDYALNVQKFEYPNKMNIVKPGKTTGILFGGNLFAFNNIIEKYPADNLEDIILFFEEIEDEASDIKQEIKRLKSSPIFNKVNGIVIGNLVSKNSNEDPVKNIKSEFAEFNFPIIKVDYFGHNVQEFYPLPLGAKTCLDTANRHFALI